MRRYRILAKYPTRQKRTLSVVFALTVLSVLVAVVQPWPLKILIDFALGDSPIPGWLSAALAVASIPESPAALVILAACASVAIFAIGSLIEFGLGWGWELAGQRMVFDLATDLFDRYQRLSLQFHRRRSVGDSLSRLVDDTYCVYRATSDLIMSPLSHILTLFAMVFVAWSLDPVLTGISLAVAPAMAASAVLLGPSLKRQAALKRETRSRVMAFVHQTLSAIPVVQAFGTEDRNQDLYDDLAKESVAVSKKHILVQSRYQLLNGLIISAGTAVVLYFGGLRVLAGSLTVGSLLVFIAYLRSIHASLKGLIGTYGRLKGLEANMERVVDIMEMPEAVPQARSAKPIHEITPRVEGRITFENVSFGYEDGHQVLQNVSLDVRPGQTVAIVGQTGAGKTTFISLLLRFFDPSSGRILLDGIDLRDIELESLRSQISLMMQDPFLLPLTVRENIAYGRLDANDREVEQAARIANAEEFIRALPEGFDSVIGQQGSTLSGGQKQRLAMARALVRQAAILILDEPTSSLDVETEADLLTALEQLSSGRTTFIIAHRLSTIRTADRIIVLEDGQIVEDGTHGELLLADGRYSHLYHLQTGHKS